MTGGAGGRRDPVEAFQNFGAVPADEGDVQSVGQARVEFAILGDRVTEPLMQC